MLVSVSYYVYSQEPEIIPSAELFTITPLFRKTRTFPTLFCSTLHSTIYNFSSFLLVSCVLLAKQISKFQLGTF